MQVPPYTPFTSSIYIATDQSGWNAQAIPMDRVDALHYQITRRFNSGTIFRYLYDRGSLQSQEIAQNGLARTPRNVVVTDADVRVIRDTVYAWQDAAPGGLNQVQPQIMPTPYNPAPFPNLPPGSAPPTGRQRPPPPPKCQHPPAAAAVARDYRTVSGIDRVTASPRALRAITCIVKSPRTNHGSVSDRIGQLETADADLVQAHADSRRFSLRRSRRWSW